MKNKINHIGVIMDGNRRWARMRDLPSIEGHTKGAWNLFYLCDWCIDCSIRQVTVFVFSTYNWNRTKAEINGLFSLVERIFRERIDDCVKKGIKINIAGDMTSLPKSLIEVLKEFLQCTAQCNKLILNIAINYGGREEIVYAINKLLQKEPNLKTITMEDLTQELYCKDNIDLIIRSGGFKRLSNFMIWQAACSEFYFTDVLWPDFNKQEFEKALMFYEKTIINNGK